MGILREWFGPSRTEIWHKLSREIGGSYTERTWRHRDRVQVEHRSWTITLDTYVVMAGKTPVPFTRLRAPFLNTDQWRFKIYRSNLFSALGKWLGMQDIEVGSSGFDADFVVKSNDATKVKRFCANAELQRLLAGQKSITLSLEDHEGWFGPKFPADTDELRIVVGGHLKDMERLRALFELLAVALDQMCSIGAAYEEKPELRL